MTIIELLIVLIILYVMYRFMNNRGHVHKFVYMYSTPDNEYNWFYCEECMIQGCAKINNSGIIEIQYFNTKKAWKKK